MTNTTENVPIACSLTAADYRRRVADANQLARDALRTREPIERGVRLTFTESPEVRARLEALVAAESECCPFLTMRFRGGADRIVLDVTGPDDAAPILEEIFAREPTADGRARRG